MLTISVFLLTRSAIRPFHLPWCSVPQRPSSTRTSSYVKPSCSASCCSRSMQKPLQHWYSELLPCAAPASNLYTISYYINWTNLNFKWTNNTLDRPLIYNWFHYNSVHLDRMILLYLKFVKMTLFWKVFNFAAPQVNKQSTPVRKGDMRYVANEERRLVSRYDKRGLRLACYDTMQQDATRRRTQLRTLRRPSATNATTRGLRALRVRLCQPLRILQQPTGLWERYDRAYCYECYNTGLRALRLCQPLRLLQRGVYERYGGACRCECYDGDSRYECYDRATGYDVENRYRYIVELELYKYSFTQPLPLQARRGRWHRGRASSARSRGRAAPGWCRGAPPGTLSACGTSPEHPEAACATRPAILCLW